MKIIYWSDFNCPNSYIGLNRIRQAASELNLDFEWELKAFELEPASDIKPAVSALERYAVKYGLTLKEAEKEIDEIESIAESEGLNISYKTAKITSSRSAHRLVKYAQKNEATLAQDLIENIFEANFSKNQIIADEKLLTEIACEVGLDGKEVEKVLKSNSYDIEVDLDEEDARFNGLYSIPFYLIIINEEQLSVPGAFEKEDFKIAMKDLLSGEIRYKSFI